MQKLMESDALKVGPLSYFFLLVSFTFFFLLPSFSIGIRVVINVIQTNAELNSNPKKANINHKCCSS